MNAVKCFAATMEEIAKAQAGSYYTIRGAGGDIQDWISGYEGLMAADTYTPPIGKPVQWYTATGQQINDYARAAHGELNPEDIFDANLTFLLFPLDGLEVGRLAIFRIAMQDIWFDDMIANMRPAHLGVDDEEEL